MTDLGVGDGELAAVQQTADHDRREARDSVSALSERISSVESVAVDAGNKAAIAGRTSRSEVSGLLNVPASAQVRMVELTDLIMHSLKQAEEASAAVLTRPTRKLFWLVAAALAVLAIGLAGIGAYVVHHNRQTQYEACLQRNEAQKADVDYRRKINGAVIRAAKKGSILAQEFNSIPSLDGILKPKTVLPNCSLLT